MRAARCRICTETPQDRGSSPPGQRPPPPCEQTNTRENITFPILRMCSEKNTKTSWFGDSDSAWRLVAVAKQSYTDMTETVILPAQYMNSVHAKRCQSTHTIHIDIFVRGGQDPGCTDSSGSMTIYVSLSVYTQQISVITKLTSVLTWLLGNFNSTISGEDAQCFTLNDLTVHPGSDTQS